MHICHTYFKSVLPLLRHLPWEDTESFLEQEAAQSYIHVNNFGYNENWPFAASFAPQLLCKFSSIFGCYFANSLKAMVLVTGIGE